MGEGTRSIRTCVEEASSQEDEATASATATNFQALDTEFCVRPVSAPDSFSSCDALRLRPLVFSRHASATTKPSNDGSESDHRRLMDALNLEDQPYSSMGPADTSDRRLVANIPLLTCPMPGFCDTTTDVSTYDHVAAGQQESDSSSTLISVVIADNGCLGRLAELPTPQQSSTESVLRTCNCLYTDNETGNGNISLLVDQQPIDINSWLEVVRQSREQQLTTDSQGVDAPPRIGRHQHWSNKSKTATKSRINVATSMTKRVGRKMLLAPKMLRTMVRCLTPKLLPRGTPEQQSPLLESVIGRQIDVS